MRHSAPACTARERASHRGLRHLASHMIPRSPRLEARRVPPRARLSPERASLRGSPGNREWEPRSQSPLVRLGKPTIEPFDWAARFETSARALMMTREGHPSLIDCKSIIGDDAAFSVPTLEHYLPLLYVLGTQLPVETVTFPVEGSTAVPFRCSACSSVDEIRDRWGSGRRAIRASAVTDGVCEPSRLPAEAQSERRK